MPTYCEHSNCTKRPYFGPRGGTPTFCNTHKRADMINLIDKLCTHEGCQRRPYYGLVRGVALFCSTHKSPQHINVKDKVCATPGCTTVPYFGPPGGKPTYCVTHKLQDHIDLKNKNCKFRGCTTRPCFGPRGGSITWCATHAFESDINLRDRTCEFIGCETIPIFGPSGGSPVRCAKHMLSSDVDTKNKRCASAGCKKCRTFGPLGKAAVFCVTHKHHDHVDVVSKKCTQNNCTLHAIFGPADGYAQWCRHHKTTSCIDRKHRLCQIVDCVKNAGYGYVFQPKTMCSDHRLTGMYAANWPKCPCGDEQPCWTNEESNYPLRCEECKRDDDHNVVEQKCETCGLLSLIREDFADCDDCAEFQLKKPLKQREMLVKAILDEAKIPYKSHDKIPENSCHRYRPDFYFDWGTHIVILEVDEEQHRGYACECDHARMINLFQDQGGMKTLFIRFNPDAYKDKNGKRHQWTASRGTKLLEVLRQTRDHLPEHLISAVQLYYDDFDANAVEFIKLEYGL